MDQIDSRPHEDELEPYSPHKNKNPIYKIIGIIFVALLIIFFFMVAFSTDEVVKTSGENATTASSTTDPIATGVHSFDDCQAGGFTVLEIYPSICELPDGRVFTQRIDIPNNWREYADPRSGTSIVYPSIWDTDQTFAEMKPSFTRVENYELVNSYTNERYEYDSSQDVLVQDSSGENIETKGLPANITIADSPLKSPVYSYAKSDATCGSTLLVFRANNFIVEFESPIGCSDAMNTSDEFEYSAIREEIFEVAGQLRVS